MYAAVLPASRQINRITPLVIHQKVVRPLDPLRERIRDMNYIFKLRVPNCYARSFSSVDMAATVPCATPGIWLSLGSSPSELGWPIRGLHGGWQTPINQKLSVNHRLTRASQSSSW